MDKQIIARESKRKMEDIENTIYIDKEKARADAHYYKVSKMIEAEQKQLTPEYLKKLAIESISNNTKLYFGESIPKFIMENVDRMSQGVAKAAAEVHGEWGCAQSYRIRWGIQIWSLNRIIRLKS